MSRRELCLPEQPHTLQRLSASSGHHRQRRTRARQAIFGKRPTPTLRQVARHEKNSHYDLPRRQPTQKWPHCQDQSSVAVASM